jgi:hypothetical protein
VAIIRGIIIPYQFPIIANIGNMQAFWGLAPFATQWRKGAFCNNVAIIRGIIIPYQFPIIANIGNFLNEHGGVTNRKRFVSVRGGWIKNSLSFLSTVS